MQVVVERVAGLDVHKKSVTGCVRTPDERPGKAGRRRSQTKKFSTFSQEVGDVTRLADRHGVTLVVMEATGVFWKPVVRHEALLTEER
jgi:transposase